PRRRSEILAVRQLHQRTAGGLLHAAVVVLQLRDQLVAPAQGLAADGFRGGGANLGTLVLQEQLELRRRLLLGITDEQAARQLLRVRIAARRHLAEDGRRLRALPAFDLGQYLLERLATFLARGFFQLGHRPPRRRLPRGW